MSSVEGVLWLSVFVFRILTSKLSHGVTRTEGRRRDLVRVRKVWCRSQRKHLW